MKNMMLALFGALALSATSVLAEDLGLSVRDARELTQALESFQLASHDDSDSPSCGDASEESLFRQDVSLADDATCRARIDQLDLSKLRAQSVREGLEDLNLSSAQIILIGESHWNHNTRGYRDFVAEIKSLSPALDCFAFELPDNQVLAGFLSRMRGLKKKFTPNAPKTPEQAMSQLVSFLDEKKIRIIGADHPDRKPPSLARNRRELDQEMSKRNVFMAQAFATKLRSGECRQIVSLNGGNHLHQVMPDDLTLLTAGLEAQKVKHRSILMTDVRPTLWNQELSPWFDQKHAMTLNWFWRECRDNPKRPDRAVSFNPKGLELPLSPSVESGKWSDYDLAVVLSP